MTNRYQSPAAEDIAQAWHLDAAAAWDAQEVYPRRAGAFIRSMPASSRPRRELVVGAWGLITWFAGSGVVEFATNNVRVEDLATERTCARAWALGQRCIVPAASFDELLWAKSRNVWWRYRRADAAAWGLAGLWSAWIDPRSGARRESFATLTVNADTLPLMARAHVVDAKSANDASEPRCVVAIEAAQVNIWLDGDPTQAGALLKVPPTELFEAAAAPSA